jgi:hypothetical protein
LFADLSGAIRPQLRLDARCERRLTGAAARKLSPALPEAQIQGWQHEQVQRQMAYF